MPRHHRLDLQAGWHHVMNRGLDRQTVFRSKDDRLDFGRLLGTGHERFGVDVVAYCLMDNHFHVVLSCPDGGLSDFMQHVGAIFTRHANERHGGDGPVFRGRFFSRPILTEQYLLNAVRYVHRNVLDIRPAIALPDYRWSSHRTYVGMRPRPPWLTTAPVLDWFGSRQGFHEFVVDDQPLPGRVPAAVDEVLAVAAFAVGEFADELGRSPQGAIRTIVYLLLDVVDIYSRRSLIAWLAPSSPEALRQATRRATRTADANAGYQLVVDRVIALLSPTFTLCLTQRERQGSQGARLAS